MKRNARVALALVSALILSACNSPSTESAAPAASAAQASTGEPVTKISAEVFEKVKTAKGFQTGTLGAMPTAYVMFDPQCPHCGVLWSAAKPLQSKISVKWIPVALLKPASETQAALLIGGADPVALMNAHEASMLAGRPDSLVGSPDDKSTAAARDNTALMVRTVGSTSIPTIIYLDPATKQPQYLAGAMPTERLAALLGVQLDAPTAAPAATK